MRLANRKIVVSATCRKLLQPFMQKLHLFSLTGMNYGNANRLEPESTGEKWVLKYISGRLKNDTITIFDVGANKGSYALLAWTHFKNHDTEIYAFEPSKLTFDTLSRDTAAIKNIRCYNNGFSDKDEALNIYANYQGSGATTLYKKGLEEYTSTETVTELIGLTTLDNFCATHHINTIDFLKIDVEGHELAVLKGATSMLNKSTIRFIQFEFGSFHVYSRTFFKDFWDLLTPLYNLYRIVTDGIYEIKSYSENLEIFRTANFLAELRASSQPFSKREGQEKL